MTKSFKGTRYQIAKRDDDTFEYKLLTRPPGNLVPALLQAGLVEFDANANAVLFRASPAENTPGYPSHRAASVAATAQIIRLVGGRGRR